MRRMLALALALFGVASGAHAQGVPATPDAGAIDASVRGLMEKHGVPGASVAVVKDGVAVVSRGYGLADVELSVPATEESVYQLASVTKTFTASGVMLLVQDGKVGLDDKVAGRIPDLPEAWKEVTVRQLLNHTSGIKSYTSVKDFHTMMRKDFAHREILALVAQEPLEFAPGSRWSYSNTGYFLLGMLIERASGQTYPEFMASRIFRPLGMSRTRVNDLGAIIPGRARGYSRDEGGLRNGEYVSPTQPYAAGALVSTVADLVKWDAALAAGTLLPREALQEMWTATPLGGGGGAEYGLGWSVSKPEGHRMTGHGGGIPGFSTQLIRLPDDRLTVIVLTNLEGGHAETIARELVGLYIPALAPKPAEPVADPDPRTTARLRAVLAAALKGEADPAEFSELGRKELIPRIRETKGMLTTLGDLKSFELTSRQEAGEGLRLRYRAGFGSTAMGVTVSLDKEGKVQGLLIRPAD